MAGTVELAKNKNTIVSNHPKTKKVKYKIQKLATETTKLFCSQPDIGEVRSKNAPENSRYGNANVLFPTAYPFDRYDSTFSNNKPTRPFSFYGFKTDNRERTTVLIH